MQSTHKIPGVSATRWSKYLISQSSRGDYYTRDGPGGGQPPTRWHGPATLLRSYGIDPAKPVELQHLRPLMQGFSPVDGEPIRPAGSNKTRTAGIDMTFSPPKDVSALWATSSEYRRAQIEAAHRKAVASALARTEREVALVRRKKDGRVRFEKAKRLLAAESVHTTSRLARDQQANGVPDPQLHSHVAVIAAERQDGKIAAVESRQLYLAAREGGAWYRSELAQELRQLGLGIERRTGKDERYFAIEGVSEELSEHWSKRGEDVQKAAQLFRQRYGREPGPGELDSLTLVTRGSKSTLASIDVNAAWRALGEEHDQSQKRSEKLFNDRNIDHKPKVDLAKELLSKVTKERSMITERELRAKAYELSAGVCPPAQADRLVNELARSGELVQLRDGMWTTRQLREMEQTTVDIAQRRATENTAPVSEQSLKQARHEIAKDIQGSLTQEQREALERITGPGGVTVLIGRAGTGKGVTISAAARAWQLEGNEVIGTAIAGATAQRLQADAKLDKAFTTDGLLGGVEKGHIKLGANSVVIMDEAGMGDSDRLTRLVKVTAEHESKLLLAGDSAQLGSIGPGGLLKEIQGKVVPTAELTEVHRAHHEWERKAWEQIRNGEPGPALAQYQAHDRLHIHDTRAQATEAMLENWDRTRRDLPGGQAVMITDASNKERDQMNAMAQERRAQAGELGAHRVELPGKPYGLANGDEVIFTSQYRIPGSKRVENGITGRIVHAGRGEDESRVTINTREREPRDVQIDTSEFSDISLAYAVHVHKSQGLTAETSGILTGGWQTDKEHTYVAISRAREQTQIYVSREDLGEQGMDTGAIERLAQRTQRTRAQEATITKETADRDGPEPPEHNRAQQTTIADRDRPTPTEPRTHQAPLRRQPHDRGTDDDNSRSREQPGKERTDSTTPEPTPQTHPETRAVPIDIQKTTPDEVQITARDFGDIKLAHSQVYYLSAYTGEATYTLFGAWQTEHEQGFVTATQSPDGTDVQISREDRGERDIQTELTDRVGQVIEQSQSQEATGTTHHANTAKADRERQPDQPAQLEYDPAQLEPTDHAPDPQPEREPVERDPYIEHAIQAAQERQQAWDHGIEPDRENDHGFGIE